MFTKTIEAQDHQLIDKEKGVIIHTAELLSKRGIRCDIGHAERLWEYGFALKALQEVYVGGFACTVADIGAGWSPLGPCLSSVFMNNVTEAETDYACKENRHITNLWLRENGNKPIRWVHGSANSSSLKGARFDAVFCISVMEHVDKNYERQMWHDLAALVNPDGLLYITCDVMGMPGAHVFDNLRVTNYTMSDVRERVTDLVSNHGMSFTADKPDWIYHGDYVHDYSFCMITLRKDK